MQLGPAMTVYLVSRHPGAVQWLSEELRVPEVQVMAHLDDTRFLPGDKVCGVLPIAWAARICAQGAEAHVLTIDLPPELRGRELNVEQLRAQGARLVRYEVRELA